MAGILAGFGVQVLQSRLVAMVALLAIALTSVVSSPAAGKKEKQDRSTSRSVSGVVTDEAEKPLGSAVVQLKNTKSLEIRSYFTKDTGEYQFQGLNPDIDYELSVQGSPTKPKTLSSFDSRKQAIINLRIEKK